MRSGVTHLLALAGEGRPAGGAAESRAREYCADVLRELGFVVTEEVFQYSAFPGRLATPIAGAVLGASIVTSSLLVLRAATVVAIAVLATGALCTSLFARSMMRNGVLNARWQRCQSINLAARRGAAEPRVWLVAHLDSKSQPIPSAIRVAGVTLLVSALGLATLGLLMTLAGITSRTIEWIAIAAGVIGTLPVMASVVGERSDGAVDNASGVAAVLSAAALVSRDVALGVLLPSAEELGLAGARAWVRQHTAGIALNCDGVDDDGALVIMYNQPAPARVIAAVQHAVRSAGTECGWARRMPLGLLTDSTAFAGAGWEAVTVSHGSLATLRRVHSASDSLAHLRGTSIGLVAHVLARAAEALAT
ncbi:MAG: M28 family metallopeptidase [Gemmatimonadota bacterium]|nr:M28 family metallopeptidase [Gemmatimonadota bacterium]